MKTQHFRKRSVLLAFLLVPILLMWRAWRRVQIDHALFAALSQTQGKLEAVHTALRNGADPNASDGEDGAMSVWTHLRTRFLPSRRP